MLLRLVLAVGAVGLLAAGCGSDDGGDESSATTAAAEATTTTVDATAAFCDAAAELSTAFTTGPDVDFETATDEEIAAGTLDFAADLAPSFEALEANAPDEVADAATTMRETVEEAVAADDGSLIETDAFTDAASAMFDTATPTCEWTPADVSAVDYSFDGVPETVPAGPTAVVLTNDGDEAHEMIVFRKNDGVTESFDDLLALPEDEAEQKVTVLGGVSPTEPGEDGYAYLDLESGEYMAICFLPTGGEEGPPHFLQGMKSEFTVE
jgi:hypothetical protein